MSTPFEHRVNTTPSNVIVPARLYCIGEILMARRRFDEMNRMFDDLNRKVEQMSTDFRNGELTGQTLLGFNGVSLDLQEHEDGYSIVADLPGFEPEELDIVYRDGMVRIDATHDGEDNERSQRRTVRETITVPTDVIPEEATATYRNGVLEIFLPAAEPAERTGHRIDVQAA